MIVQLELFLLLQSFLITASVGNIVPCNLFQNDPMTLDLSSVCYPNNCTIESCSWTNIHLILNFAGADYQLQMRDITTNSGSISFMEVGEGSMINITNCTIRSANDAFAFSQQNITNVNIIMRDSVVVEAKSALSISAGRAIDISILVDHCDVTVSSPTDDAFAVAIHRIVVYEVLYARNIKMHARYSNISANAFKIAASLAISSHVSVSTSDDIDVKYIQLFAESSKISAESLYGPAVSVGVASLCKASCFNSNVQIGNVSMVSAWSVVSARATKDKTFGSHAAASVGISLFSLTSITLACSSVTLYSTESQTEASAGSDSAASGGIAVHADKKLTVAVHNITIWYVDSSSAATSGTHAASSSGIAFSSREGLTVTINLVSIYAGHSSATADTLSSSASFGIALFGQNYNHIVQASVVDCCIYGDNAVSVGRGGVTIDQDYYGASASFAVAVKSYKAVVYLTQTSIFCMNCDLAATVKHAAACLGVAIRTMQELSAVRVTNIILFGINCSAVVEGQDAASGIGLSMVCDSGASESIDVLLDTVECFAENSNLLVSAIGMPSLLPNVPGNGAATVGIVVLGGVKGLEFTTRNLTMSAVRSVVNSIADYSAVSLGVLVDSTGTTTATAEGFFSVCACRSSVTASNTSAELEIEARAVSFWRLQASGSAMWFLQDTDITARGCMQVSPTSSNSQVISAMKNVSIVCDRKGWSVVSSSRYYASDITVNGFLCDESCLNGTFPGVLSGGEETLNESCSLHCEEPNPMKPRLPWVPIPIVYNQDGLGFSGVLSANPLTGSITMVGYDSWPAGYNKDTASAFLGGVFDGQRIWLCPYFADRVIAVNKDTAEMNGYNSWPDGYGNHPNNAFAGGIFEGKAVWMVPFSATMLIKVDRDTGSMTGLYHGKGPMAYYGGIFDGSRLWMSPYNSDSVAAVDVRTGKITAYSNWPNNYTKEMYAFSGCVFDGESMWMMPSFATSIVAIDTYTGQMKKYDAWPSGFTPGADVFRGGTFDGQSIWAVPSNSKTLIKISVSTGTMTAFNSTPKGEMGDGAFCGGIFDGQRIWLIPRKEDSVIAVDKDTGEMIEYNSWPNPKHALGFFGGVFDGTSIWLVPAFPSTPSILVRLFASNEPEATTTSTVEETTTTEEESSTTGQAVTTTTAGEALTYSQDGFGFSGVLNANPLKGSITMVEYNLWPAGTQFIPPNDGAFFAGVFDGQLIWLIPMDCDRVVSVDKDTGVMRGYDSWPPGFTKTLSAFFGGVFDGESVFMIPYTADRIIKVNITSGAMDGFSGWPAGFTKPSAAFAGGIFSGELLVLVPFNADCVICFHVKTGEMQAFNSWPAGFVPGSQKFRGGAFDGELMWLVPYNAQAFIAFDPLIGFMMKYDSYPAGFTKGAGAFEGGTFDGQSIWAVPSNSKTLMKISVSTGTMTPFSSGNGAFYGGVFDGQRIWLIPGEDRGVIAVDKDTAVMKEYNSWPSGPNAVNGAFHGGVFDGHSLWLVPNREHRVIKISSFVPSKTASLHQTQSVSLSLSLPPPCMNGTSLIIDSLSFIERICVVDPLHVEILNSTFVDGLEIRSTFGSGGSRQISILIDNCAFYSNLTVSHTEYAKGSSFIIISSTFESEDAAVLFDDTVNFTDSSRITIDRSFFNVTVDGSSQGYDGVGSAIQLPVMIDSFVDISYSYVLANLKLVLGVLAVKFTSLNNSQVVVDQTDVEIMSTLVYVSRFIVAFSFKDVLENCAICVSNATVVMDILYSKATNVISATVRGKALSLAFFHSVVNITQSLGESSILHAEVDAENNNHDIQRNNIINISGIDCVLNGGSTLTARFVYLLMPQLGYSPLVLRVDSSTVYLAGRDLHCFHVNQQPTTAIATPVDVSITRSQYALAGNLAKGTCHGILFDGFSRSIFRALLVRDTNITGICYDAHWMNIGNLVNASVQFSSIHLEASAVKRHTFISVPEILSSALIMENVYAVVNSTSVETVILKTDDAENSTLSISHCQLKLAPRDGYAVGFGISRSISNTFIHISNTSIHVFCPNYYCSCVWLPDMHNVSVQYRDSYCSCYGLATLVSAFVVLDRVVTNVNISIDNLTGYVAQLGPRLGDAVPFGIVLGTAINVSVTLTHLEFEVFSSKLSGFASIEPEVGDNINLVVTQCRCNATGNIARGIGELTVFSDPTFVSEKTKYSVVIEGNNLSVSGNESAVCFELFSVSSAEFRNNRITALSGIVVGGTVLFSSHAITTMENEIIVIEGGNLSSCVHVEGGLNSAVSLKNMTCESTCNGFLAVGVSLCAFDSGTMIMDGSTMNVSGSSAAIALFFVSTINSTMLVYDNTLLAASSSDSTQPAAEALALWHSDSTSSFNITRSTLRASSSLGSNSSVGISLGLALHSADTISSLVPASCFNGTTNRTLEGRIAVTHCTIDAANGCGIKISGNGSAAAPLDDHSTAAETMLSITVAETSFQCGSSAIQVHTTTGSPPLTRALLSIRNTVATLSSSAESSASSFVHCATFMNQCRIELEENRVIITSRLAASATEHFQQLFDVGSNTLKEFFSTEMNNTLLLVCNSVNGKKIIGLPRDDLVGVAVETVCPESRTETIMPPPTGSHSPSLTILPTASDPRSSSATVSPSLPPMATITQPESSTVSRTPETPTVTINPTLSLSQSLPLCDTFLTISPDHGDIKDSDLKTGSGGGSGVPFVVRSSARPADRVPLTASWQQNCNARSDRRPQLSNFSFSAPTTVTAQITKIILDPFMEKDLMEDETVAVTMYAAAFAPPMACIGSITVFVVVSPAATSVIEAAQAAASAAVAVGAATASAGAVDAQALIALGSMECASPMQQKASTASMIFLSPFYSFGMWAMFVGNAGIVFVIGLIQTVCAAVMKKLKKKTAVEAAATLRFPTTTISAAVLLFNGVVYASWRMLLSPGFQPIDRVIGVFGVLFAAALIALHPIMLVRLLNGKITFETYDAKPKDSGIMEEVFLPLGRWAPPEMRHLFGRIFASVRESRTLCAFYSLYLATLVNLFGSIRANDTSCIVLISVLSAVFFISSITILLFSVHRSPIFDKLAAASMMCLGLVAAGNALILSNSQRVGIIIMSIGSFGQAAVSAFRFIVNLLVRYTERKYHRALKGDSSHNEAADAASSSVEMSLLPKRKPEKTETGRAADLATSASQRRKARFKYINEVLLSSLPDEEGEAYDILLDTERRGLTAAYRMEEK